MRLMTFNRRIFTSAFGWKTAGVFLITIAAFCNVSSKASAAIITFEPGDGMITIPGFFSPYHGAIQYVEDSMTMNASNGIFELGSQFGNAARGTELLMFTTDHADDTVLAVTFAFGGGPFDLISADVFLDFYGFLRSSLGGAVGPGNSPGDQIFGMIDFTQLPGWRGITSFTMTQPFDSRIGDISISIDNIVFQPSAIPEPSTLALLVFGLAGLVGCRKRRLLPPDNVTQTL